MQQFKYKRELYNDNARPNKEEENNTTKEEESKNIPKKKKATQFFSNLKFCLCIIIQYTV